MFIPVGGWTAVSGLWVADWFPVLEAGPACAKHQANQVTKSCSVASETRTSSHLSAAAVSNTHQVSFLSQAALFDIRRATRKRVEP